MANVRPTGPPAAARGSTGASPPCPPALPNGNRARMSLRSAVLSRSLAPALVVLLTLALNLLAAGGARAQDRVWVQIEAQPTLAEAAERAAAYAAVFPETQGYRLRSGWYGIALGPYGTAEGAAQFAGLVRENLIPSDSYITDGSEFREQFWPAGAPALTPPDPVPPVTAEPLPDATAQPAPAPEPVPEPEETVQQARASEAALSDDERKLLQTALQWYGFYQGGIDGAFGPGTRNSMAAWQAAAGLEPTGVLTTGQRARLVGDYQAEVAAFGFETVTDGEAGIEVTLPLALVEFDRYEPPFVHFRERNGSGLSIMLISQPGDAGSFLGLYDILQSLEVMPQTGERSHDDREFRIHGTSADRDSHARALFEKGFVKGWMLVSTPATADRDARILQVLDASFRGVGDIALDPGLVPLDDAARRGLLAGLEVRKPRFSRSGFFLTPDGAVLTTAEAVAACGRVTIEGEVEASVTLSDAATGLAVVTPARPLSPPGVARFQIAPDRIGAEIAVAGYSYEDRLPAPVLTWGVLEDVKGLDGEAGIKRLAITTLPGDAGGPVVDATGAVLGMLMPAPDGGSRQLPPGVAFATAAAGIAAVLTAAGIPYAEATGGGALPPETLTQVATDMTVLVSCWD